MAKVTRLDKLKRKLDALRTAPREPMVQALGVSADEMVDLAQSLAPEHEGKLKQSIRKVESEDGLKVRVVAGGELTMRAYQGRATYEREVKIGEGNNRGMAKQEGGYGVSYDYALAMEFGNRHVKAHPFFFPAYRTLRKRITSRATRAGNQAIKQAAQG